MHLGGNHTPKRFCFNRKVVNALLRHWERGPDTSKLNVSGPLWQAPCGKKPNQRSLRWHKILQHGLAQQLGRQQTLLQQEVVVFPLIEPVTKGHLYLGA